MTMHCKVWCMTSRIEIRLFLMKLRRCERDWVRKTSVSNS